ncbi:hypothetical protein TrVE_jg9581 [Triparma verrucosa]|uniref:HCP-like protein n=1 Tax=Triparma verrucosa TaxID=1606542 RepID=A0A9W7BL50_9STRA|nr:hypothetical protein TrVE_jg9581 [Triparma verrucosa]
MGGGSSAFLSFEEFQKARKIIDERGKLDSNAELLSRVKEALASPQTEIDSLSETPIVLAMKSPKAASRQTPKAGAGGVFFNQHEEEDFATLGEDDEDNQAMLSDLVFMADGGDVDSAFDLGVIYRTGSYGVKKDSAQVVKWWKKAAEGGVMDAAYNLAVLYHHGQGVEVDLNSAIEFYELARGLGNQEAPGMIATLKATLDGQRQSGKFFDGDELEGGTTLEAYEMAAEGGDKDAMFKMGNSYAKGDMGLEVDFTKAGSWWWKATCEEHELAWANLLTHADDSLPADEVIGKVSRRLDGKQRSDWTRIQTKLEENLEGSLGALQVFVAQVYWWGQGNVERDEGKCIEYLTKARDRGSSEAWYLFGGLYDSGDFDDVEKDEVKAAEAFKKAAELGHMKAKKWVSQYGTN